MAFGNVLTRKSKSISGRRQAKTKFNGEPKNKFVELCNNSENYRSLINNLDIDFDYQS